VYSRQVDAESTALIVHTIGRHQGIAVLHSEQVEIPTAFILVGWTLINKSKGMPIFELLDVFF
jgi:hypothetical protein